MHVARHSLWKTDLLRYMEFLDSVSRLKCREVLGACARYGGLTQTGAET